MAVMFGTNWSAYSDQTGPVIGPLTAYEVPAAIFLEAGFLGVMLFGLERVGGHHIVRPKTVDRAEMR
jgi:cytochrome d ubiquinol oxidase subunit I